VQNIRYAFRFIKESFSIAFKTIQLQEQWVYIAVGNLILLFFWFLPLGLVLGFIGLKPVGMLLIGLIGVFMLFSFYAWSEITREPASRRIVALFQEGKSRVVQGTYQNEETLQAAQEEEGDEKPLLAENLQVKEDSQDKSLFKHWADILILTLVLPGKRLIYYIQKLFKPEIEPKHAWIPSYTLLVPVISIENRDIKDAVRRIDQMIDDHLLRFQPGLVKVDLVGSLVQWILCFIGILIGLTVAILITDPIAPDPWLLILGLGVGMLIVWLFITSGNLFSAYSRSFYHTALYKWVRNVEEARKTGELERAVPPNILRQAIGKNIKK
jgi:Zn-dependent membrane protease YugP